MSSEKALQKHLFENKDCNTGGDVTFKLNGIRWPVTIRRAGSNTEISPHANGKRLCTLAVALTAWTTFAQSQIEPSLQRGALPTPPFSLGQDDKNGNRIDDKIDQEIHKATLTLADLTAAAAAKFQAKARLAGRSEVRIIFNRQITREEWGTFVALGGQVESAFEAVATDWSGSVALEQIPALAVLLGPDLVMIRKDPKSTIRPKVVQPHARKRIEPRE